MSKSAWDLTRANNNAAKEVLDALVELNAWKFQAEQEGWMVRFVVQNGDVDVTLSRDAWPTFEDDPE